MATGTICVRLGQGRLFHAIWRGKLNMLLLREGMERALPVCVLLLVFLLPNWQEAIFSRGMHS
jgi:hypothetical protein